MLEQHTSTQIIIEEEKEESVTAGLPVPELPAVSTVRQPLLRRSLLIGSSITLVLVCAVSYLLLSGKLRNVPQRSRDSKRSPCCRSSYWARVRR